MVKIILKNSAQFKRKMYQVGEPTLEYSEQHEIWLQDQNMLSHTNHCRLRKVYIENPFHSGDTRISFNIIINFKFGEYLKEIQHKHKHIDIHSIIPILVSSSAS